MSAQSVQVTQVAWLDARETLTAAELAQVCGISSTELDELVDYGALEPVQAAQPERGFSGAYVAPLRTAARLRQDFDLDLFTVTILLDYLNRIEELEQQVHSLRAHLPGQRRR
ncbi:MAG: hypothetical protein JWQ07_310 [Ramlibacter sp.]|nr:hypothetical protein [Ramlibacter sp.]